MKRLILALAIGSLPILAIPAHAVLLPPSSPQNVQHQGFCAPGDVSHNGVICRNDPVNNVDQANEFIADVDSRRGLGDDYAVHGRSDLLPA